MASATSTPSNKHSSVLFDSVTSLVPPGHEKPFKQAFYTTAALFFFGLGTIAAISVYYILEAFIRPLLWALLCGSFLFPFKYSLNSTLESWLNGQMESGRPLFAGTILLPFSLFDSFASKMGNFVVQHWKVLATAACILSVVYALYLVQLMHILFVLLMWCFDVFVFTWEGISWCIDLCAKYRLMIMTIVGAYFIMAMMLKPTAFIKKIALPMWILLLICIASVAGNLQVPVGVLLTVLIIIGGLSEVKHQKRVSIAQTLFERTESISALLSPTSSKHKGFTDLNKMSNVSEENINEDELESEIEHSKEDIDQSEDKDKELDALSPIKPLQNPNVKKLSEPIVRPASTGSLRTLKRRHESRRKKSASDVYFNLLFGLFTLVLLFHYIWLMFLIMFPLIYWLMKKLLCHESVRNLMNHQCAKWLGTDLDRISHDFSQFIKSRNDVLMPRAIHGMGKLILKGDKKFHSAILTTLPTVCSIIIILFIFIGSLSLIIFLAAKVQQESFVIVQMTSDVINDTVSKHPEYKTWLPDNETMESMMDLLVDNLYLQGREWISAMVNTSLDPHANVSMVEKQALKVWDRAYTAWFVHKKQEKPPLLHRQSTTDMLQSDAGSGFISGLLDLFYMTEVIDLMKENMSALKSVGESLWAVLQSNISLAISSVSTVFAILLSGGSAILNLLFSIVIFFTALFYLLMSSDKQYKPVEMFGATVNPSGTTGATTIASSIQRAISDVFGASLKMASFYGLYTWLNHTTMGAHLVYIPSVLAALFGVVPVLTTYWSCLPACLEIWLLQGSPLRAVSLFLLQIIPTWVVDAAIYSEISAKGGGHPYITGLAVVGGVYCYGIEGAIIGPIVLCCLLVVINVFTNVAKMPADTEPPVAGTHKTLPKSSLSSGN